MLIEQKKKALTDHANRKKESPGKTEMSGKGEVSKKRVIPIAEAEDSPITVKRMDTNIPLVQEHIDEPLMQNKQEIVEQKSIESSMQDQGRIVYRINENHKSVITIETLQEGVKVKNNEWEDIEEMPIIDIEAQENEIANLEEVLEAEEEVNIEDAIEPAIKQQDETPKKFKVDVNMTNVDEQFC
jgi:hypothetical protein